MNADRIRQSIVAFAVLLTLAMNGLANALPLNGQLTGEISNRFKVYFTPAGYVFSIWGLIYLGLIGLGIYQALPSQRTNPRLRQTGYLFAGSCLANIAWLFLWHYEQFPLTLVAMFCVLGSLIAVYLLLGIGQERVSRGESWLIRLPVRIYLGWITVATIANVTILLDWWQWNGWGISPEHWTEIILVVVGIIAGLMSITRRDATYLLVLVWALVGIAVKQDIPAQVTISAWITAAWVMLMGTLAAWRDFRKPLSSFK